jgi:hypothetical protein
VGFAHLTHVTWEPSLAKSRLLLSDVWNTPTGLFPQFSFLVIWLTITS